MMSFDGFISIKKKRELSWKEAEASGW